MIAKLSKGQIVKVKAFPNKIIERVVLEEAKTYVLCCRREVFEELSNEGIHYDKCMGFPKEDVLDVVSIK